MQSLGLCLLMVLLIDVVEFLLLCIFVIPHFFVFFVHFYIPLLLPFFFFSLRVQMVKGQSCLICLKGGRGLKGLMG